MIDPVSIGLIATAALAGGGLSYLGQQQANETNRQIAGNVNAAAAEIAAQDRIDRLTYFKAQQDFQEIMSNTAYQRSMADMRRSGLNPILAYQRGGATTPSGGAPGAVSTPKFEVPRMENALGPAVSSAVQAASTVMGLQKTAADIGQVQATTKLAEADTHRSNMQAAQAAQETATGRERERLTANMVQTELDRQRQLQAEAGLASARTATEFDVRDRHRAESAAAVARANRDSVEANQRQNYGPPGRISSTIGGVSQSLDSIVSGNNPMVRRFLDSFRNGNQ